MRSPLTLEQCYVELYNTWEKCGGLRILKAFNICTVHVLKMRVHSREQHLPTYYIVPHIMKNCIAVNNIYHIHQMVPHIMYVSV